MLNDIIKPIRLLSGSHADTGSTGQGCFMNVIAYLNGEPQITDKSSCVCFVVRPLAIFINDYLEDDERHILIPFIERALGSATTDKAEIERRVRLVVELADTLSKYATASAAESAAMSAAYAAAYAALYAKNVAAYAAAYAALYAASAAASAAESAGYDKDAVNRQEIIDAILAFMDQALPKQNHESIVTERATKLVELAAR